MIYSQNCYDALGRAFSWAKPDLCGGVDMLAVNAADAADTEGLSTEVEYFGSEAAAGRYLAVAIKAGEEAGEADKRLDALQRRTATPAPSAKPTSEETPEPDVSVQIENEIGESVDA